MRIIRFVIFIVPVSLVFNTLQAQSTKEQRSYTIDEVMGANSYSSRLNQQQNGVLNLIIEPGVRQLLSKSTEADYKMDGFRVQLCFGSREKATDAKTEFLKEFPKIKSYITWLEPNFRVRVGNFRTQLDAEAFLQKVKRSFPTAYVVPERIELPELE